MIMSSEDMVPTNASTVWLPVYWAYTSSQQVSRQSGVVGVVMVVAVLGNCVMVSAVWRSPHLRTLTNIFTINLALTDLAVAVLILPCWLVSLSLGARAPDPPFPQPLCQVMAFLTMLLLLVSVATLSGISLDRYLCICYPLQYPLQVTSRKVYTALTYIWLQSAILACLPFYGWGRYAWRPLSIPICNPAWVDSPGYAALILFLGILLPFIIMIFSYVRIIQEARRQACRIQQIQLTLIVPPPRNSYCCSTLTCPQQDEDHMEMVVEMTRRPSLMQRLARHSFSTNSPIKNSYAALTRNLRMLKVVFIVVGAFFVCWCPYVVLNLWAVNARRPGSDHVTVPYTADLTTTLLAFSNSALNPYVFMFLTRDFRLAVRMLLYHFLLCCPLTTNCTLIQRLKKTSRNNSVVESIRLHSRGSYDSGVELDQQSPMRRASVQVQGCYDNNGFELDSQQRNPARQRYLGEDLCFNGAANFHHNVAETDSLNGETNIQSPDDQISIIVPIIPGQLV